MILYYKSNSEGGIWRVAIKTIEGDGYVKSYNSLKTGRMRMNGIDYITETFINMELQEFISKNIHKIPYSYYNNDTKTFISESLSNGNFYTSNETKETSEEIKKINISITNFNPLTSFVDINMRDEYDDIKYPFLNILRHHISCGDPIDWNSLVKMKEFFEKKSVSETDTSKLVYINTFNGIIGKYLSTVYNKDINYHKVYYTILSDYLRTIGLTYDNSTCKYLYSNRATIGYIKNDEYKFDIINNYYSIDIKIGSKFKLYFTVYSPLINGKTINSYEYRNIVNIVPFDNDIQATGQNTKILSIGNYICKVVEYYDIGQTSINSSSNLTESCEKKWDNIQIDHEYVFVGHCSSGVYPLDQISIPPHPPSLQKFPEESTLYYPPNS
jgi:hypothetical protein